MSELRALRRVAVEALDRVVTTPVEQTHRAIARRAFDGAGRAQPLPAAEPSAVYAELKAWLRAGREEMVG